MELSQRAAVDGYDVAKPKRQIRKILGQDFLGFAAEGFSFFLIHFHSNLVGKRVETRITVVSAVGAVGWESL